MGRRSPGAIHFRGQRAEVLFVARQHRDMSRGVKRRVEVGSGNRSRLSLTARPTAWAEDATMFVRSIFRLVMFMTILP